MKEKDFKFFVNKLKLTSASQFITGMQLKEMAGVPVSHELYLNVPGSVDELILNDVRVNLGRPGVEHFYTKEPQSGITLMVNGDPHKYDGESISFLEVVKLAFPDKCTSGNEVGFTVSYSKGPDENVKGEMSSGMSVVVKNLMQFDVTATHIS